MCGSGPGAILFVALVLTFLLVGLTSCAQSPQDQVAPSIVTTDDLIGALREAGAQAQVGSGDREPVLEVPAQAITVDGAEILVYEYATEDDRQAVSADIIADPRTVGGTIVEWPTTPKVWGAGRLVVVYLGRSGGTTLLLNSLLGDPLGTGAPELDEPYPPAVTAAIQALASRLSVDPASIEVVRFEPVDWSDVCLGLPGSDELCAEVVTPGWLVELRGEGAAYEAHTDQLGNSVRLR
jgi:hypothetical protein